MNKTVDNFEWDAKEDWSPEDFFAEVTGEKPEGQAKGKPEGDDKPESKPVEEDPFADLEEVEEDEAEDQPKDQQNDQPKDQSKDQPKDNPKETKVDEDDEGDDIYTALAKDLHELGYIPEVKDKFDAAKILDTLEASLEERIDSGVEQVIESWKTQIGDVGAKFIQFTINGGNPNDFFSTLAKQSVDISTERGQELFLRDYLIEQGMDAEDVDAQIELYKENETLEKYAKKYHSKVKSQADAEQQRILAETEARKREREEQIRDFNNNLKKVARDTDHILISGKGGKELGKINFTEVEKRSLVNYITQNTVQKGDRFVSEFTEDFNKIYKEKPEKLLLIAKLLKNDFDLSDFVQSQVSEQIKEVKSNLQRVETKKKTKTKTRTDKPVWEYF